MENAEKHSHGSSSFHFSPIELIETNWGRSFKNFFLPSIRWMMKEREHERLNREWVTSGGTTGKHGKRHLGWGEQLLIQDALICRINNTRLRETVVTTASNNPWNYSKYHGNRTIPVANPSDDRTASVKSPNPSIPSEYSTRFRAERFALLEIIAGFGWLCRAVKKFRKRRSCYSYIIYEK